MDEKLRDLESENERMREALRKVSEHYAQIQKILESVSDLLTEEEQVVVTQVTEEDVKHLLKKYSRLN